MPSIEDVSKSFLDSDEEEFLRLLDEIAPVKDKDGNFRPAIDVLNDMAKYFSMEANHDD